MNPSGPFIRRPVMTTLMTVAVFIMGVWAYFQLPVSNMPDIEYPSINVSVPFPGANPETMANNVATPLEKEFLTIDGLVTATSANTLGNTSIILQFDLSKNIDVAAQDVQAAISRALPNLPPQLPSAPTYRKVNPSLTPIIILALTSETATLHELYDYANILIGQQLSLIKGVAQVVTYGSPYAVRVQVDPGKLATNGITLLDLANVLASGNPYLPTGYFDGTVDAPNLYVRGQLLKADQYNPLIVSYVNNAPVRIQDLGQAVDSLQNYRYSLFFVNKEIKEQSIALAVLPEPGSNAVYISNEMNKLLPAIIEDLPPSMELRVVNDKTDAVHESINEVQITLLIAFVLVVFIVYLYLGQVRETIIPAIALPLSVVGTFALMRLFHFNLDNLSILGLILASGFIIDDAIVVIENIVRRIEGGEKPWNAALAGSSQIGFTIVSMTLSLIAVFIPLLFMGGLLGKVLAEFAFTLTFVTILSGLISLTLTPMLCSIFLHPRTSEEKKPFGQRMHEKLLDFYKPRLRWILAHRYVAGIALFVTLGLSLLLLAILPRDFIPNDDIGFFIIYTQSAEGTSSSRMEELQNEITEIVRKDPNVDQFLSIAASQQFRNGICYVHCKPRNQRKPILDVIAGLQKQTSQLIGINAYYKNVPMIDLSVGSQVKGAYQYALRSFSSDDLYPVAETFIAKMRSIPGLQGINSDLEVSAPQIYVDIPRDKASSLGVTAADIESAFRYAYAGGRVTRIQGPVNQYDVILELQPRFQRDPRVIDTIYVRSNNVESSGVQVSASLYNGPSIVAGQTSTFQPTNPLQLVPLSAVTRWYEGVGPTSINHINQFPGVTVSFNLAKGETLSSVLSELAKIEKSTLKKGVWGHVIGAAATFEQSITSAAWLLLVTLFVIYLVLGVLYESYIHPITILTTLPPAIVGGLLVLFVLREPLSLYSFLGIILLIGIVKKNGIMMVDFALENIRVKGESAEKSIYDACLVRFRPIMMTTLIAIAGAFPLALGWGAGADARRPLGYVIIGGLLISQLITLFITPVIYLYFEDLRERANKRRIHKQSKA